MPCVFFSKPNHPTQAAKPWPFDSMTYSWDKTAGSNPQSGTWKSGTTYSSVDWQAPPCTGTVIIKLTADDEHQMNNPCPDSGSTRDDAPVNYQDTATVSLPGGCEYAGAHDSSIHWTNPDDDYLSTIVPPFGFFGFGRATYEVDFKYEDCSWVCEINDVEAKTVILVRDPDSFPVSVSQASDVPCGPNNVEALLAKYDLNDTDLNDDEGAPRTKYWCYNATVAHEEKHRSDWKEFYGASLSTAISVADGITEEIDCDIPWTIFCQSVKDYWMTGESGILFLFAWAYASAIEENNNPDTPVDEADVRAYEVSYSIEQPISAALPGGCTP